ncbi:hypothetical protein M3212_12430 [Alkalihalobacillus oceani]|uniref:hypothetical protein n=1 Tax=Halalkalibacter oceani TaxID=1653776 RepID=UPI002040D5AB|nr:hypothetical protein [Halalkalibacter oceani]MCM3761593.1 hypothetical protein [Halalkalibacter oceani]
MAEQYQQQLMEIVVDKVLKKYNVDSSVELTSAERDKVKEIVEKMQADVEHFLANQNVQISDRDFSSAPAQGETPATQTGGPKPGRTFVQSPNNVHNVKTFTNKKR